MALERRHGLPHGRHLATTATAASNAAFCVPIQHTSHRHSSLFQGPNNMTSLSIKRRQRSAKKQIPLKMAVTEDPITKRVRDELAETGVNLDELLNAAKVVNLTRKLDTLTSESSQLAADSTEAKQLQAKISQIERDLVREKRQVMQTWLKQLFLAQAYVFIAVGGLLSADFVPGVSVPLVGQALGFWTVWLFTIPALRARKGIAMAEKSALNVSFLAMPFVNLTLPFLTKNCAAIWFADVVLLAGCYAYYFVKAESEDGVEKGVVRKEQGRVKGVLKYLDWGSWR